MNRLIFIILLAAMLASCDTVSQRYITVEGRYSEDVTPDKVIMTLELSEYWREELIPGTLYNDYRNRGPGIDEIEKNVRAKLSDAGMPPDAMTVMDTGTRYRDNSGRDLLTFRRYEIALGNLTLIPALIEAAKGPEVKLFNINELTHSDIEGLKNDTSQKALGVALAKAKAMVKGYANVGRLITVQEGNVNINMPILGRGAAARMLAAPAAMPMAAMANADAPQAAPSNPLFDQLSYNKIKVSSVVQATFKLKN